MIRFVYVMSRVAVSLFPHLSCVVHTRVIEIRGEYVQKDYCMVPVVTGLL